MNRQTSVVLDERRVFLTGAAGGIGTAIAQTLHESGASVFATDAVPAERVFPCDVSSEREVAAAFAEATAGGAVTDVIHAAGICTTAPIAETTLEDWERIIRINLTGAFLVGREASRTIPDGGNIVFVASVAGLTGDPFFGAYCASKFGVVAITQVLARELGHRGIRVNAVCPGGVKTAMSDQTIRRDAERLARDEDSLRALYSSDTFLNRWADPEEVASACAFLVSPSASYISGHSLVLNGGGNLSSHR